MWGRKIADEDGAFNALGSRLVAFGTPKNHSYGFTWGAAKCDATRFRDANPGEAKACYMTDYGRPELHAVTGPGMPFTAKGEVAFGSGDKWTYRILFGEQICDPTIFGQPASASGECLVALPQLYTHAANQGEYIPIPMNPHGGTLAFGGNGKYLFAAKPGGYSFMYDHVSCDKSNFDGVYPFPYGAEDPHCYVLDLGNPYYGAGWLADEGGTAQVPVGYGGGLGIILYGSGLNGIWRGAQPIGGTAPVPCTNDTFGDPDEGKTKSCWMSKAPQWSAPLD
jgi:hypothetical protein